MTTQELIDELNKHFYEGSKPSFIAIGSYWPEIRSELLKAEQARKALEEMDVPDLPVSQDAVRDGAEYESTGWNASSKRWRKQKGNILKNWSDETSTK